MPKKELEKRVLSLFQRQEPEFLFHLEEYAAAWRKAGPDKKLEIDEETGIYIDIVCKHSVVRFPEVAQAYYEQQKQSPDDSVSIGL
jgi:hypothetical protein